MHWKAAADELRQIDLKRILPLLDAVADRYDRNKWHTRQGVISVSRQKFINWNQGCGGGGAIDLVIHLKQCDFKTALHWLAANFPYTPISNHVSQPTSFHPVLQLPPADRSKLPRVIDYLIRRRCIDPSLVNLLMDSKTLYADHRANAVFLLLGKEKKVVGAELRGTASVPWRGMAPGSRKDIGYFSILRCKTKTSTIVLCESAIDALSYLTMFPNALAISTSGASPNPTWLQSLLKAYTIFCGFDADPTGDHMAEKMISIHPTIKRFRPPKKDWNDLLRAENPASSMAQFS
jgi:hypothetical protein